MQDPVSGEYEIAELIPDFVEFEACDGPRGLDVVAFYCPNTGLTPCDIRSHGAPFANFWPLPSPICIEHNGARGTFSNSEAAYQSLKWWQDAATRKRFEECNAPGLQGGGDAYVLKRECEGNTALSRARKGCNGLDKWDAMLLVLRAKWRLPGLRELLISSAGMYLVEHSALKGRDPYWTDDETGGGQNRLGAALMLVRDELLLEGGQPSGWPAGVPRPSWGNGGESEQTGPRGADADDQVWQQVVDNVAKNLVAADEEGRMVAKPRRSTSRPSSTLAKLSFLAAWAILGVVFVVAYLQGPQFASTKDTATVWGALIGLAAFFAWLAVDEDDEGTEEDEQDARRAERIKKD
jgi:predicted NAD-dependent protein-ADP-ribosyltransferase YbiA (DUF1768 family)